MANFQMEGEIFFVLRNRDIKDSLTAVTTSVTAHDRYNECGSPRFQGK